MRLEKAGLQDKGWYAASWELPLAGAAGYAHTAINEPHFHRRITEVYLIARGSAQAQVGDQFLALAPGNLLVIEPGEARTFLSASPDYFHFVLHLPRLRQEEALADKILLSARGAHDSAANAPQLRDRH
jgi:uncharacterized protein YjlB